MQSNYYRNISFAIELHPNEELEISDLIWPTRKTQSFSNDWDDKNRGRKKVIPYRQIRRSTNKYR